MTTTHYTTLADLIEREITPALAGVEPNFDIWGFSQALRDRELIDWTGNGFALVTDGYGATAGFWDLVSEFDAAAKAAEVAKRPEKGGAK